MVTFISFACWQITHKNTLDGAKVKFSSLRLIYRNVRKTSKDSKNEFIGGLDNRK